MAFDIVRLTAADHEELVDFIDLVFGIDFKSVLPRLYQRTDECMSWQYAITEGGKIRAAVGAFPMRYVVGGSTLNVLGIGNVAVHRDHRSKGYMKVLLNAIVADSDNSEMDFSWLTGQRQRYQHFGYETCGASHNVSWKSNSLRHTLPAGFKPLFSFHEVDPESSNILDRMLELYNNQSVRVERRREDFLSTLRVFEHIPQVICSVDGSIIGYLSRKGGAIGELVLEDDGAFTDVINSLAVMQHLNDISIATFEHQPNRLVQAVRTADYFRSEHSGSFRLCSFESSVKAFLALKAGYSPLPPGRVVLASDLFGSYEIVVSGQDITVRKVEDAPDVILQGFDVYQLLLGSTPIQGYVPAGPKAELILAWFPLPLSFPMQDRV